MQRVPPDRRKVTFFTDYGKKGITVKLSHRNLKEHVIQVTCIIDSLHVLQAVVVFANYMDWISANHA